MFVGNEVRFKGAYFLTCTGVVKNADGSINHLTCTYDEQTKSGSGFAERKVKGTIHWIDAKTAIPITVREYDYLYITDENGEDILNPASLTIKTCLGEPSILEAQCGEAFQFFRHGYYCVDTKDYNKNKENPSSSLIFNKIVGLKTSFKL
jgi:glutaminyl-tRNA synthetase